MKISALGNTKIPSLYLTEYSLDIPKIPISAYQGTWKSGDAIWKHAFMPLYCNYQGTWKSGDAVWRVFSNICTAIIKSHENQVNT